MGGKPEMPLNAYPIYPNRVRIISALSLLHVSYRGTVRPAKPRGEKKRRRKCYARDAKDREYNVGMGRMVCMYMRMRMRMCRNESMRLVTSARSASRPWRGNGG